MSELRFEVSQVAGNISYNLDAVRELAENKVSLYKGIVVTEDTTKSAKEDIAELRKFQKDIDTARKQVKSEYIRPLEEFEDKCKMVIALLEEPIQYMDKQVKDFELQKKNEKKAKIVEVYEQLTSEYAEYLPISKFYKPQWENTATSLKAIEKDITALVDQASMAVMAIKSTESEFVDKGLEALKVNLDVAKAMTVVKGYEAQKREILEREERRKREEEERKQRIEEARMKAEAEAKVKEEARIKAEAEAIARESDKEKVICKEEEPFDSELPFIPEEEAFVLPSDPFVTRSYIITETLFTHSFIEEELTRMGIAFFVEEE